MTFKLHIDITRPGVQLVRRPWWNFWGRDRLVSVDDWVRITHAGLTPKQKQLFETEDRELSELLAALAIRPGERLVAISYEESA